MTTSEQLFDAAHNAHTAASDGIGHAHLRQAVHSRVFGESDPVRVGRYTVLERVGCGAMAVVYAAYDNELDRKVAVKVLRMDRAIPRQRLLREAKALARVSHPNVVHVYEVGEHDGEVYMAMELVRGTMLGAWLSGASRSWREIVGVFVDAARGLAAAHAQGVVHRDFKPDNVLVGDDGRVRVVDFGLAIGEAMAAVAGAQGELRGVVEDPQRSLIPGLTETGAALGTPGYMAPEQMEGAPADPRVDQFALCVALYEALVGHRPFDADRYIDMRERMAGPAPDWPSGRRLPAALKHAVLRGLRESPEQRHVSMEALIEALLRAQRRGRRRALMVGGAAVLGMAMAGSWWIGAGAGAEADEPAAAVATGTPGATVDPAQDQLTLEQARSLLAVDPTAAVERLAMLTDVAGAWAGPAWAIAAEAWDQGIARRALNVGEGSALLAAVGERTLVGGSSPCELRVHGPQGELGWRHSADCDGRMMFDVRVPAIAQAGPVVAFADQGGLVVTDLERGMTRRLGYEHEAEDLVEVARSGAVIKSEFGRVLVWEPGASEPQRWSLPMDSPPIALSVSARDGETIVVTLHRKALELRRSSGRIRSLQGATTGVVVSDDGQHVVARRADGSLAWWRSGSDEAVKLGSSDQALWPVAFSGDGRRVAVVEPSGGVQCWNLPQGRREGFIDADEPRAVTFSADGSMVAFVDHHQAIVARASGQVLQRFRQRGPIRDVQWNADGEVVTMAGGGELRTWSVPAQIELPPADRRAILALAFVPEQPVLLSVGSDWALRRWDLTTGHGRILTPLAANPLRLEVSPDGQFVLIVMAAGPLAAWDLEHDALMVGPQDARGHAGFVSAHEVSLLTQDGITTWDLQTGRQSVSRPVDGHCRAYATASSAGLLVTHCGPEAGAQGVSLSGEVRVWSVDGVRPQYTADDVRFMPMALDPQGRFMIHTRPGSSEPLEVHPLSGDGGIVLPTHQRVVDLVFDERGERAMGRDGGALWAWRPQTGDKRRLRGPGADHYSTAYAIDGRRYAYGTEDGRISVVDDPAPTDPIALRSWVRDLQPERITGG